jgi:hypothetical protein
MKPSSTNTVMPEVKTAVTPSEPTAPKAYAVALLKFAEPQDGPGLSVASSLTCRGVDTPQGRASRHTCEFMPWVRAFRVTYTPPDGPPVTGYIPESRIAYWQPA